jgi:hypothetical protein
MNSTKPLASLLVSVIALVAGDACITPIHLG